MIISGILAGASALFALGIFGGLFALWMNDRRTLHGRPPADPDEMWIW